MSSNSSTLASLARWMSTSSSIIGTAIGVPTVAAALSGTVPWQQAVLPLAGAAIAVLMPQAPPSPSPSPRTPPTLGTAVGQAAQVVGQVGALLAASPQVQHAIGGSAGAAIDAVRSALIAYDEAQARMKAAQTQIEMLTGTAAEKVQQADLNVSLAGSLDALNAAGQQAIAKVLG